jgi:hypothetical protein
MRLIMPAESPEPLWLPWRRCQVVLRESVKAAACWSSVRSPATASAPPNSLIFAFCRPLISGRVSGEWDSLERGPRAIGRGKCRAGIRSFSALFRSAATQCTRRPNSFNRYALIFWTSKMQPSRRQGKAPTGLYLQSMQEYASKPAHNASKTRVNALVSRASTSFIASRIKDVDGRDAGTSPAMRAERVIQ